VTKPLIVDLKAADTAEKLHTILSDALKFPDYYGKNWDAFNDVAMSSESHGVELPERAFFTSWWDLEETLPREAKLFTKCVKDLINRRSVDWMFVHEIVGRQPREDDNHRTIHNCLREDCSASRDPETKALRWTLLVCGHGYWPCGSCRYPIHPTVPCPRNILDEIVEA
jgi:ribonuclease inhibitor